MYVHTTQRDRERDREREGSPWLLLDGGGEERRGESWPVEIEKGGGRKKVKGIKGGGEEGVLSLE